MKIGILTFHYSCNYGAVLQCASLVAKLKQLGHEIFVINFVPDPVSVRNILTRGWGIRTGNFSNELQNKIHEILNLRSQQRKFALFRSLKFTSLPTQPIRKISELSQTVREFDAIISGSDQVWNFKRSEAYFLAFDPDFTGRKISYAACCTSETQPPELVTIVGDRVKKFSAISVRNSFSQRAIMNASGIEPIIVADPTLLHEPGFFSGSNHSKKNNYIFVYILGKDHDSQKINFLLHNIRSKMGDLPIVQVTTHGCRNGITKNMKYLIHDAGPEEWINLISGSSAVITDSYHASLYSMRFKLPTAAFYSDPERSPRLIDLANRYKCTNCFINLNTISAFDICENIASDLSIELMNKHANDSCNFLENSLTN